MHYNLINLQQDVTNQIYEYLDLRDLLMLERVSKEINGKVVKYYEYKTRTIKIEGKAFKEIFLKYHPKVCAAYSQGMILYGAVHKKITQRFLKRSSSESGTYFTRAGGLQIIHNTLFYSYNFNGSWILASLKIDCKDAKIQKGEGELLEGGFVLQKSQNKLINLKTQQTIDCNFVMPDLPDDYRLRLDYHNDRLYVSNGEKFYVTQDNSAQLVHFNESEFNPRYKYHFGFCGFGKVDKIVFYNLEHHNKITFSLTAPQSIDNAKLVSDAVYYLSTGRSGFTKLHVMNLMNSSVQSIRTNGDCSHFEIHGNCLLTYSTPNTLSGGYLEFWNRSNLELLHSVKVNISVDQDAICFHQDRIFLCDYHNFVELKIGDNPSSCQIF